MSDITKVQCRKCLLEDMDENDFLRDMRSHIEAYPADKRVSEEEYRQRLAFCKNCEKLVDGMCVLCGCYVELRAVKQVWDVEGAIPYNCELRSTAAKSLRSLRVLLCLMG